MEKKRWSFFWFCLIEVDKTKYFYNFSVVFPGFNVVIFFSFVLNETRSYLENLKTRALWSFSKHPDNSMYDRHIRESSHFSCLRLIGELLSRKSIEEEVSSVNADHDDGSLNKVDFEENSWVLSVVIDTSHFLHLLFY